MEHYADSWSAYLDERLALLGWSRAELARRCDVTPEAVSKAVQNRAFSVKLARAAETATAGLLKATILVGLAEAPVDPLAPSSGCAE